MINAVHHIGLSSPQPTGTLSALATVIDASLHAPGEPEVWLQAPNAFMLARRGPPPQRTASVHATGVAHLCLRTHDAEEGKKRLEAVGMRLLAQPQSLGTGFHYSYIRDAEARLLEMETAPFLPTSPRGWFAHVAFVTPNLARLSDFYAVLLALSPSRGARTIGNDRVDAIAQLRGIDLEPVWLQGLNLTLELWRYHAPALVDPYERQCGYTHVAFETEHPVAASERALSLGATADTPESLWGQPWPAVRDPDGNRLVFVHPPDTAWRIDHLSGAALEHGVLQARDAYLRARQGAR